MKKISLFLILLLVPVLCQELPQHTDKYVNDFANMFSAQEVAELRSILYGVEQDTTCEVVVVTINTTAPYAPSEYRTKLFNYWGVGKADVDNGLLVLYAVQEHRIEVEVGYGLEGVLPDSKVGRMLDESYVPLRDSNKTTEGILNFTKAVAVVLNQNKDEILSRSRSSDGIDFWMFMIFLPFIILGIFVVVFIFINRKKFKLKGGRRYGGWGGGFGGGGFGGGGFGGGGSGGGGAGR